MISIMQRASVRGRVPVSTLRRRAHRLLEALGRIDADLVVLLTDDREIRTLNRDYRDKDRPTDVLSFAQGEGEAMPLPPGFVPPLGDVVISLETAERQVDEGALPRLQAALGDGQVSWALMDEVTFLMLHGVLHLIGHDHMSPAEADRMFAEESRLLPGLLNRRAAGTA